MFRLNSKFLTLKNEALEYPDSRPYISRSHQHPANTGPRILYFSGFLPFYLWSFINFLISNQFSLKKNTYILHSLRDISIDKPFLQMLRVWGGQRITTREKFHDRYQRNRENREGWANSNKTLISIIQFREDDRLERVHSTDTSLIPRRDYVPTCS